jgi:hypothetical protein
MAGCVLGLALAEYFVQRAKLVTGNLTSIGFNGNDAAVGGEDFVVSHYYDTVGLALGQCQCRMVTGDL